jgi:hypothetical protein
VKQSGALTRKAQLRSKRRDTPERAKTRSQLYARDQRCRLAGSTAGACYGKRHTPHHLWKEGQGGPYRLWNLLTLCAHHNDWIEYAPRDLVAAWGLVIEHGQSVEDAWCRLVFFRIVDYWWDGTPADQPMPALEAA